MEANLTSIHTRKFNRSQRKRRKKEKAGKEKRQQRQVKICSQNIQGIQVKSVETDFALYLSKKLSKEIDIMGWAETNIEWRDFSVYEHVRKTCRKFCPRATLTCATSKMDVNEDWKPGGNAILTNARLTTAITQYGNDPYGRWSWVRLRRKKKSDVLIV